MSHRSRVKKELIKEFERAVFNAVAMAKNGYSLSFSSKRACEQAGYPVKSHVDAEMRLRLGERFLELRAESARKNHGKASGKTPGDQSRATYKIASEIKRTERHYKTI